MGIERVLGPTASWHGVKCHQAPFAGAGRLGIVLGCSHRAVKGRTQQCSDACPIHSRSLRPSRREPEGSRGPGCAHGDSAGWKRGTVATTKLRKSSGWSRGVMVQKQLTCLVLLSSDQNLWKLMSCIMVAQWVQDPLLRYARVPTTY